MPFAQAIIGPPGSGKSTYCQGIQEFLTSLGKRKPILVNLDPANDSLPYSCDINIFDLISVEQVMLKAEKEHEEDNAERKDESFGPNGALLFCMEYLEKEIDWLLSQLALFPSTGDENDYYFIFDLPGQAELFTHHSSLKNILKILEKRSKFRFTIVELIDSTCCIDPFRYISSLLLCLNSMLFLELPQVNVLSKIDLLVEKGENADEEVEVENANNNLMFGLDFYTQVQDLSYLFNSQSTGDENDKDDPFTKKYSNLTQAICNLIEESSLVSFHTLNIEDKYSVANLLNEIDRANGFAYGGLSLCNESILSTALNIDKIENEQDKFNFLTNLENKHNQGSR